MRFKVTLSLGMPDYVELARHADATVVRRLALKLLDLGDPLCANHQSRGRGRSIADLKFAHAVCEKLFEPLPEVSEHALIEAFAVGFPAQGVCQGLRARIRWQSFCCRETRTLGRKRLGSASASGWASSRTTDEPEVESNEVERRSRLEPRWFRARGSASALDSHAEASAAFCDHAEQVAERAGRRFSARVPWDR